jgi:hypothetical protein
MSWSSASHTEAPRISAKSESSLCVQNMGTHAAPVRRVTSRASPTAGGGLVQRVERSAERRRLLAGHGRDHLAAREALEVRERRRRGAEPAVHVGE